MAELNTTSCALLKVILTGYGFWNLDFFRCFIPPFCVSQGLKNIHVLTLQCVSLLSTTAHCTYIHLC